MPEAGLEPARPSKGTPDFKSPELVSACLGRSELFLPTRPLRPPHRCRRLGRSRRVSLPTLDATLAAEDATERRPAVLTPLAASQRATKCVGVPRRRHRRLTGKLAEDSLVQTRGFGAAALKSTHADVSELRHRQPRRLSLLRPVPEPPHGGRT
jgi:hypothetical protein